MKLKKIMILILFLSFVISISFVTLNKENVIAATVDKGASGAYVPSSSTIKDFDYIENNTFINMNDLYTENNGNIIATSVAPTSKQLINISTSKDLYAFSVLCNSDNRFLTYSYQLTNNIDYGKEIAFNAIGTITPFSGLFEGNGYEISNLHFRSYTSEKEQIEYIAMFSKNSGTINGIGLIDTELVQSIKLNNIYGVAPLVGLNSGTISNVFVKDLRDPYEEAGISAVGYYISGLCFINKGTIENTYVAYSTIINYTIFDYEAFRPIIADVQDGGILKNVYFYDSSIDKIETINGIEYYIYDETLLGDVKIPKNNIKGEYVNKLSNLRDEFKDFDGWYSNLNYSTLNFNLELPIFRGLEEVNGEGKTFNIKSEKDFVYIYELFNKDPYFASRDFTYYITTDLDLSIFPNTCYIYDDFINASFIGKDMNVTSKFTFNNGKTTTLPTIYNPYINNTINYLGFKSYGLFPLFDGTIKNLNIYLSSEFVNFKEYDNTTPISTFGVISGYMESALVSNVNVYANISLSNNNLGQVYIGGAIGILSQKSKINNLTISGSINGSTINVNNLNNNITTDYVLGNIIGGAIAYITNEGGDISDISTNLTINALGYSASTNYSSIIGGVVGCGYFDKFNNISSLGSISANNSYSGNVYISGIIGKIIGVSNRIYGIHNQMNINMNVKENKNVYVSGITNVSLNTNDSSLNISSLNVFYASGLSNSGIISINKNFVINESIANSLNINVTNGIYLENAGEIEGLYNLDYYYDNNNEKHKLNDTISIDVALIKNYAPCLIKTNEFYANVKSIYNFRDINLTSTANIYFTNVLYTGCISGKNINLTDIRNEGNINANISNNSTNALTLTNGFKKFVITGVFEEVSRGYSANIISNNGNINFYIDKNVNTFIYNLYISGICYANRSTFTDSTFSKYNPLNDNYDSDLIGTLNNAINNGTITSTNYASETVNITSEEIKSANEHIIIGIKYTSSNTNTSLLYGSSNISGICSFNESIISNTFNIGDITNFNYIVKPNGNYNFKRDFEVNSAGITFSNIGKYAQIKDSANNGVIKAFNMSSSTNSWANSAGISVRNDIDELYNDYDGTTNNASQMILFTINYGEIYSHNYCENVDSIEKEQHAKSAGIMALGLCSIINTVNYGNIYGSEISSGIFSLIKFSLFKNEVTNTNKVIIANSINYGNIWGINKGSQAFKEGIKDDPTKDNQTYQELMNMSFANQSDYASIDTLGFAKDTYLGSIIGIANFDNSDNAQNISIRYLINFCNTISIIGGQYGISSNVHPNVDTMVSTYVNFTNGLYTFDKFMGATVQYGPLSTGTEEILGKTYLGVFNEEFQFRKAVEGKIEATEITDKFISDYFQFVAFTKVNDYLIEKIGWRTIAFLNASIDFANDLTSLEKVITMYENISVTKYTSLVSKAINTDSWISNCKTEVVIQLTESLIQNNDLTNLQELLSYLFFESSNINAITSEIRSSVVTLLMKYINENKDIDIKAFLNSILFTDANNNKVFSTILTDIFSSNLSEKVVIKEKLQSYFESLSNDKLKQIVNAYIELLNNDDNIIKDYINQTNLLNAKRKVIKILLNNIDTNIIFDLYKQLDITSTEDSKILKMYDVLEKMSETEKQQLFEKVLNNNTDYNSFSDIIDNLNSEIKYYEKISKELDTSITQDNDLALNNNYLKLWNKIRLIPEFQTYLDSLFKNINDINGNSHKGIYAKATEARNTFQSDTVPAPNGRNVINFDDDKRESLIFDYQTKVNPDTYFYGPFINANGNKYTDRINGITYDTSFTDIDKYASGTYQTGNQLPNKYVNGFVTTNKTLGNQINGKIFFFDTNNNQFVSESHFDNFSNLGNNLNNFGGTTINGDSHISGLTVNGSTYTYSITDVNGVKTDYTITDVDVYSDIILKSATKYYISSANYTGIYMYYNPWKAGFASYFTAKDSYNGNTIYWYTTQYIDYSASDLVKLDGRLTSYTDAYVESQDEIDIINNICNNYLFSSTNKSKSIKVIKKLLLQLFNNDASFVNDFLTSIADNNDTISSIHGTIKDYLTVDSKTFANYLIDQYNGDTSDDVSIYGAVKLNNFKFILDYLLNDNYGYYAYLYGKMDISNLNDTRIKYLFSFADMLKQYNSNLSNDEIIEIISKLDKNTLLDNYNTINVTDILLNNCLNTLSNDFDINIDSSMFDVLIENNTFNNKTYVFGLTSNQNNSIISFTPNLKGTIKLVAKGSGTINLSSGTTTDNITINNNINEYTFNNSTDQNPVTLTLSRGITIYEIYIQTKGNNDFDNANSNANWELVSLTKAEPISLGNTNTTVNKVLRTTLANQQFTFTVPNAWYLRFTIVIRGINDNGSMSLIVNNNSTSYTYTNEKKVITENNYLTRNATYTVTFNSPVEIYGIAITQYNNNNYNSLIFDNVSSSTNSIFKFNIESKSKYNDLDRNLNDIIGDNLIKLRDKQYNTEDNNLNHLYSQIYKKLICNNINFTNVSSGILTQGEYQDFTFNLDTNPMKILTLSSEVNIDNNVYTKALYLVNENNKILFNVSNDSYVFVYASGTGFLNLSYNNSDYYKEINGESCYVFNVDGINNNTEVVLKSNSPDIQIFEICIVNKTINLNEKLDNNFVNFPETDDDRTEIKRILQSNSKYLNYIGRINAFINNTRRDLNGNLDSLYKNDFINLITLFSGSMFDYNNNDSLWNYITYDQAEELAILLGIASDDVLKEYINRIEDIDLIKSAIIELTSKESRFITSIMDKINSSNLTEEQKKFLVTAYVSTDFNVINENSKTNESITVKDSELFNIIRSLKADYRYYNEDGSIDNAKFEALMKEIGFNLATQGYGIYALASSHGILNGAFIPDNFVLAEKDNNPKYELNGNYFVVTDNPSSDWRSKVHNDDESTTNINSINYAIKKEMKQLKLSIATTIFDLTLVNKDGYILTTSDEYITLDISDTEGKVTYYVPSNLGATITGDDVIYSINSYKISDNATLENGYETKPINKNTKNVLRVYAEDTTVYKDYEIEIVETGNLELNFTSYSTNTQTNVQIDNQSNIVINNIEYNNGRLLLNANIKNVANLIDLTRYVYIDSRYQSTDKEPLFSFNNKPLVNSITQDNGLTWDGNVAFDITFSPNLSGGEHTLDFIFSNNLKYSIKLNKNQSNKAELISLTFDGKIIDFSKGKNQSSTILFGRYFNYNDFIIQDGNVKPDYLDNLVTSPLAKVTTSAEIMFDGGKVEVIDNVTVYTGGQLSYKITYTIVSEDGTATNTYTHTLIEIEPFNKAKNGNDYITGINYNKNNYVSIYQDGGVLDITPDTAGVIKTSFSRGNNPKYRVIYNLDDFYKPDNKDISELISVKSTYDKTKYPDSSTRVFTSTIKHKGYTLSFYNASEIDDYIFNLEYESTTTPAIWENGSYRRNYLSSDLIISKTKSTDAFLKKITFITEATKLANLATVMSLNLIYADNTDNDNNKIGNTYQDLVKNQSKDFVITTTYGITYLTNAAQDAKDYYIVGTVSNANLDDYAPLFKIEDHASIYQYVYFNNVRYLIVSFFDNEGNKLITYANEALTEFYLMNDDRSLGNKLDSTVTDDLYASTINYNGTTYKINQYVGMQTNANMDLFMNFVGEESEDLDDLYYVDYVVYAEAFVPSSQYYKNYHISVIDLTNSIYFTFSINDKTNNKDYTDKQIFVQFICYDSSEKTGEKDYKPTKILHIINAFAKYDIASNSFVIENTFQALPYGFYYIYLDLMDGHEATYTITDSSKINSDNQLNDNSYIPPTSIITQRINLTIDITDVTTSDNWGERMNTYSTVICKKNANN